MKLRNYLTRRKGSQNWQVRWMVPKADRRVVGRSEFTKSLGTTDRGEAERRAVEQLRLWEREVHTSRGGQLDYTQLKTPTIDELSELAVQLGYDTFSTKLAKLSCGKAGQGDEAFAELKMNIQHFISTMVREKTARDFSRWEAIANRALAKRGWHLGRADPLYLDYVLTFANATIEACQSELARIEGRASEPQLGRRIDAVSRQNKHTAKPGEELMELFEQFAAQRLREGRKRLDTVEQDRKIVEQFSNFVGASRAASSITKKDVRNWRDIISVLPTNFQKRSAYRGLSLKEAAAKAREDGVKPLAATTINKYLSTLSPLFAWCATNGYCDSNPCDNLFLDIRKGQNSRPPFSTEQLNTILKSPLFTGFKVDGEEHLPGNVKADDWRYWLPLLCFFSGARLGEMAQMWVDDIGQEHGIWFFRIRHDPSRNQSTKSGQSRYSPIHSTLIKMGFLDFHRRRLDDAQGGGSLRLFPDIEPNKRGQISGKPSRFWRDYLEAIGVKDGGDGLGSHSFRHGFADQLRLADYLDTELSVALGHNLKTVTSGYGVIPQGTVKRLSQMIENVTFEGVKVDHLFR